MRIEKNNKTYHISYCTNIHPCESWQETFKSLKDYTHSLYQDLPGERKGIGLRLSSLGVNELDEHNLFEFKNWLKENNYYINTINAFPYGNFHSSPVKKAVYLPDWSDSKRLYYTKKTADILNEIGEDHSSISTVPIGWKADFADGNKLKCAMKNLFEYALYAENIYQKSGKKIRLALEPEPGCYLENKNDVLFFFKKQLFNLDSFSQEEISLLQDYIGICFDTCHFAVMFEDRLQSVHDIEQANIKINKYQISSGLSFEGNYNDFKKAIAPFEDGIYLHQTSIKIDNEITCFADIDQIPVIDRKASFRTHFHVPIFMSNLGSFKGTNDFIPQILAHLAIKRKESILEVETYTFNVLPKEYRSTDIKENIKREIQWLLNQIHSL